MLPGLRDDSVRLMAVLRGQIAVPLQHFFGRQQFLAVARMMRGDLRRRRSVNPCSRRWSLICSRRGLEASRYSFV